MLGHVVDGDSFEVVDLATAQNSGYHLVLLGSGKDEHGVCRRFLQGFEESIEGLCAEHVDLVDDEDAVTAHLRRDIDLLCDLADVVDRIVGSRVEFHKVERIAHLDGLAGRALSAGFTLCVGREAVDGFGEDARAGCLAHSTRTAKQICLSQTSGLNRILQRGCQILLTDYAAESGRAVFPRTDYVITHVFYRKIYAAPARITLRRSLNHKFNKKMSNHNNNSPIALQRKNEDRRKLWRKAIYTRAPETAAPLRSWVAKG